MKIYCFFILLALSISSVTADIIMTVDRKVYYDVRIAKIDIWGMQIFHRDGIIRLTPAKLDRSSRIKYAAQVAEYEDAIQKNSQKYQLAFNKKFKALKSLPVAERLSKYAELRIFYTSKNFSWAKFDFSEWEQEVANSLRELDEKIMSLDIINAIHYADGLKNKFDKLNLFTDQIKAICQKVISEAAQDLPQIEEKMKKIKSAQRLRIAQTLFRYLSENSADTGNLKNIIHNARGDIEIANAVRQFGNSRSHFAAIKKADTLMAEYPQHPYLNTLEQLKKRHEYYAEAQKCFNFLSSAYSPGRAKNVIRIMTKALKVYAKTPYSAQAREQHKAWVLEERERERARQLAEERERMARLQCPGCGGSGRGSGGYGRYGTVCSVCNGSGRRQ